jgi:ribosomal protein L30/L7E
MTKVRIKQIKSKIDRPKKPEKNFRSSRFKKNQSSCRTPSDTSNHGYG